MGWLWACLGSGPDFLPKLCSEKSVKCSKSQQAKVSNKPHDLRLHPFTHRLPRYGCRDYDHPHLQSVPRTGRCGEDENTEAFKIPTTSVNTCISINTLKKASERSLESSFRREFGIARRSDVDDLKDEVAELRRRLASEEAEAKKLREEVSHLRSCGVVQTAKDVPDELVNQDLQRKETCDASGHAKENDEQHHTGIAPIKQLRKCLSGPMLLDAHHNTSKHCSDTDALVGRACNDSHRVGPSPKSYSLSQKAMYGQSDLTRNTSRQVEEGFVASGAASKSSKNTLASDLLQYPSAEVAAWTSQTVVDQASFEGHGEGMARDLVILDSMDVHWIEVANAPCPGGYPINVQSDVKNDLIGCGELPQGSSRVASTEIYASVMNSQSLRGERHLKSRSWSGSEPSEELSKDQSSVHSNLSPAFTSDQIEAHLALAVAAFNQQKREIEVKHQSFCREPPSSSITSAPLSNPGPVIGFFRRSRKRSRVLSNRVFHQRSLSPVKEALSIEEIAWSSQSSSSKTEPESASQLEHSVQSSEFGPSRFCTTLTKGSQAQHLSVEAACLAELPPVKTQLEEHVDELDESLYASVEDATLAPIPCSSPSLSPRKRSASAALDTMVALKGISKRKAERRYDVEDSVDGFPNGAGWEGEDNDTLDHRRTSFSLLGKYSRTSGPQTIRVGLRDPSSSPASSADFVDEKFSTLNLPSVTFKPPSQDLSLMTPSTLKQRSPSPLELCTSSPLEQWTPSPQKYLDVSPTNERSWYCDAIDAIQSISDMRSSKERRLLTESVSLGNSPVSREKINPQAGCPRPLQAISAERKALRRAFSWYLAGHDERMKTFGLVESLPQKRSDKMVKEKDGGVHCRDTLPKNETSDRQLVCPVNKTDVVLHTRGSSDSDSGDSGSATFSIDLNQGDSPSQNGNGCVAADARDGITTSASSRAGIDKENAAARVRQEPCKSILQISEQSSLSNNKHFRCSQDIVPERSILGSMPFNHWDKNPTDLYNAESRVEWRATAIPSSRSY
ncbi:uncharacterized protein [Physcomitrium patens]|uniref:Uncharacterized protein n=1 Tax=Physcomitrium patens TaxID=3218 RepID=A0A2K1KTI0_PHYPA|nr:uncharacterized protein LOC112280623 isoform X1 [Physcomitrium patens]PNR57081.1 hypothetical protein PHYPA_004074 [Physcomitrium patens]|eukprot:XP_024372064.1 uncharacterized protein LOC112280623 isoform X1 [Physcomitrella patens]